MTKTMEWENYKNNLFYDERLGLYLDYSRMNFPPHYFKVLDPGIRRAFAEMKLLEDGGTANCDENRMAGHYWLRTPQLAPTEEIAADIQNTIRDIKEFAARVHRGEIRSCTDKKFTKLLLVGIGGSVLGPMLVGDALKTGRDPLTPYYIDNTDPDGIDDLLDQLGADLDKTIVAVVSKSGGTVETVNGMLEVRHCFASRGLDFASSAVAVTMTASQLDLAARREKWLARFPVWDWVGGRTSVTSAAGLLPAALQGLDIDAFLQGAGRCDDITRRTEIRTNPAALLALSWYHATGGRAKRAMVLLPYKDRLRFLTRYLQQLIMESLGKEKDTDGNLVHQGLTVYGNKGSSDQHAYVQQLLDGADDFFATFIGVLTDNRSEMFYVQPDVTSGDYLRAFLQGTREALTAKKRESLTIILEKLDARSLGALLALYERAVGFYASLININAYHQPGVELGKKSAGKEIKLQLKALQFLRQNAAQGFTVEELALALGEPLEREALFKMLEYLSLYPQRGIKKIPGENIFTARYQMEAFRKPKDE